MLSAASSAVTVTPTAEAISNGNVSGNGSGSGNVTGATGGALQVRRYQNASDVEEDETVAYEAFHQSAKSFERAALLRVGSLTAQESDNGKASALSPQSSPAREIKSTTMGVPGGRRMFKSSSLDWPGESQQQHQPQTHPHPHQAANQLELVEQQANDSRFRHRDHWDLEHVHFHHEGIGHLTGHGATVIDDELEQHIKHCSCSCNHMGYGNSMDYQVSLSCF